MADNDAIDAERFKTLAYAVRRNNGYLARAEVERLLQKIDDKKRLEPFGFKIYSQNDEDGILEEIFRRLNIEKGRFCEIGVEHGLECNSLYLIHKGWRGVWIDGNESWREFIQTKFAPVIPHRLTPVFTFLNLDNFNQTLASLKLDEGELDLLSIDIDGNDIYMLEAMVIRPKVLCIEYNAKFPGHVVKQPPYTPDFRWDQTDYMGSSLKTVTAMANKKGYRLVGTSLAGTNAFFVRDDLAGDLFPDNATSEALYNPARYWLIWDCYDENGHPPSFGPYLDLMEP